MLKDNSIAIKNYFNFCNEGLIDTTILMFVSGVDCTTLFKSISTYLPVGSVCRIKPSEIILPDGVDILVLDKLKNNIATNLAGLNISQVVYYNCYEDDIDCHNWLMTRLRSKCVGWDEMAKFANISIHKDYINIWRY